ncbi:MAG TPA: signal peptidase I [Armatimonadota bacterium]|jgi:signal peptidase I
MESVYLKLFVVFAVLAGFRLATFARFVPARVRSAIAEYTDSGIIASVVAIFVVTFLLQISRVEGISMAPTLHGGEYTLINKLTYRWRVPERGDVIVFRSPTDPQADYIKRVIAVPGETVEVKDGIVFVNGNPLKESYEETMPDYNYAEARVPPGSLFVLGDNRNRSFDSHLWPIPFLPMALVRGRASIVLWPPQRMGAIRGMPIAGPATQLPMNACR